MSSLPEPLDLSPADAEQGPESARFHGILAEVHQCPSCSAVATRPIIFSMRQPASLVSATA
ncbi:MAG TPA: hypothetical protein VE007_10645 [Thermoanaerobaculia bacterium]|nr:hypothetical protein [Thermoanaerobaculia bacterium]